MKSTINSASFIFGVIFLIMACGEVISAVFGSMFAITAFVFCVVVFLGTAVIEEGE